MNAQQKEKMEYSVCLNAVYNAMPMPDAIRALKRLGYQAFEFWNWWDQDICAIAEAQRETGLHAAAMCARFIPLNVPERRKDFLRGLRQSISAAHTLNCKTLIAQVGQAVPGCPRDRQRASIIEGLTACAAVLEAEDVQLVVEPLNTRVDHAGYYLERSEEAFQIVREVGSPNVAVLFDVYHQQISEGNLVFNLTENLEWVGHVHIAGVPGRHEPLEDCEICYSAILRALCEGGYRGYVGLEYFPRREPEEGLLRILRELPLDKVAAGVLSERS